MTRSIKLDIGLLVKSVWMHMLILFDLSRKGNFAQYGTAQKIKYS